MPLIITGVFLGFGIAAAAIDAYALGVRDVPREIAGHQITYHLGLPFVEWIPDDPAAVNGFTLLDAHPSEVPKEWCTASSIPAPRLSIWSGRPS